MGLPADQPHTSEARGIIQGRLVQTMSQDTAVALATWIAGDRPPAVVMGEHFVPANIIGIYRQGGNTSNYLLRLRHTHGGLLVAHMLTQSGDRSEAPPGSKSNPFFPRPSW